MISAKLPICKGRGWSLAASLAVVAILGGARIFGIGVAAAFVASVAAWRWLPSRAVRLAQMRPSEDF